MEFRVVQKNIEAKEDGDTLHIRGIANTGLEDVQGDTLTIQALEQIVEQATSHNLHMDHDLSLDGVLGPITSAELKEEGVEIHADIVNKEYKDKIRELLEGGVNLGLSVDGTSILDKCNVHDINNITLTEISLTPIPCDQATMGSVQVAKSFAEVFKQLREEDIVEQATEEDKMVEEAIGKEATIELINEAFNERREEYLETIRAELKNEYEARINELEKRIDSLESQLNNAENDEAKPSTEEAGVVEEEVKVESAIPHYSEDDIPQDAEEEEEEEEDVKKADKDEEEEEDIKKSIKGVISEAIDKKLESIFVQKSAKDIHFKYNDEAQTEKANENVKVQKSFTPREIAEIMAKH